MKKYFHVTKSDQKPTERKPATYPHENENSNISDRWQTVN